MWSLNCGSYNVKGRNAVLRWPTILTPEHSKPLKWSTKHLHKWLCWQDQSVPKMMAIGSQMTPPTQAWNKTFMWLLKTIFSLIFLVSQAREHREPDIDESYIMAHMLWSKLRMQLLGGFSEQQFHHGIENPKDLEVCSNKKISAKWWSWTMCELQEVEGKFWPAVYKNRVTKLNGDITYCQRRPSMDEIDCLPLWTDQKRW